jgi:hypothetical protein
VARKHRKNGRSKHGPPFVQVPHWIMETNAWTGLSHGAVRAWLELARRYNGSNNGSIGLDARTLSKRMSCSKSRAAAFLIELNDAGFIEPTMISKFSRHDRKATEYRFTHLRCDRSGHSPSKEFMQHGRSNGQDRTVQQAGPHPYDPTPRSNRQDRQRQKAPIHGPAGGTHIDIHHRGYGAAERLTASPQLVALMAARRGRA